MAVMQGDFMNVTIGVADLTVNGMNAGYIEKASMTANVEYKEFKAGIPKTRKGKAKIKVNVGLDVSLKEIRPQNWVLGLGIKDDVLSYALASVDTTWQDAASTWTADTSYSLNDFIKPVAGGTKVYRCTRAGISQSIEPIWNTTLDDITEDGTCLWKCQSGVGELKTMEEYQKDSDLNAIQLTGYNVASIVVKSKDSVTTYSEGSDYIVDEVRGIVLQKPGGGSLIGDTDPLLVNYKFTPYDTTSISFKPEDFILDPCDLRFIHKKPTDGKYIGFEVFNTYSTQITSVFNPVDYSEIPVKWSAYYDKTRPNYSYGRITWYD